MIAQKLSTPQKTTQRLQLTLYCSHTHTHTHLPERKEIYHTLYSTGMNNIILYDTTVIEVKECQHDDLNHDVMVFC